VFLGTFGLGVLAAPLAVEAQQASSAAKIGVLFAVTQAGGAINL
jgi:hypothetical protein